MNYEVRIDKSCSDYLATMQEMELIVRTVRNGAAPSLLWFLEYPPLYTAGLGCKDVSVHGEIPVFPSLRGGRMTYHGPGQRVIYFIHKLPPKHQDVKRYIYFLEEWMIEVLKCFNIQGKRDANGVGVWVRSNHSVKKIGAIGVRIQGWVVSHGISFNVCSDLTHYNNIIPCGISGAGVTSLKELGVKSAMQDVDAIFVKTFEKTYINIMGKI